MNKLIILPLLVLRTCLSSPHFTLIGRVLVAGPDEGAQEKSFDNMMAALRKKDIPFYLRNYFQAMLVYVPEMNGAQAKSICGSSAKRSHLLFAPVPQQMTRHPIEPSLMSLLTGTWSAEYYKPVSPVRHNGKIPSEGPNLPLPIAKPEMLSLFADRSCLIEGISGQWDYTKGTVILFLGDQNVVWPLWRLRLEYTARGPHLDAELLPYDFQKRSAGSSQSRRPPLKTYQRGRSR